MPAGCRRSPPGSACDDAGGGSGVPRHRLGGRRGAGRRGELRLHLVGHLVAGRPRIGRAGADRGVAQANFTNETGLDHTIRFLRNVMGLWLMQECMREWRPRWNPSRPARSARRGRRGARPFGAGRSTPTTAGVPRAWRHARSGSPSTAVAPASRCRTDPGRSHPAASWTASRSPTAEPSRMRVRLAGRGGRGRARRGRRIAQRPAVPAHRRRHRPAGDRRTSRGDRDRQRAGAGARGWRLAGPTWRRCAAAAAPGDPGDERYEPRGDPAAWDERPPPLIGRG